MTAMSQQSTQGGSHDCNTRESTCRSTGRIQEDGRVCDAEWVGGGPDPRGGGKSLEERLAHGVISAARIRSSARGWRRGCDLRFTRRSDGAGAGSGNNPPGGGG